MSTTTLERTLRRPRTLADELRAAAIATFDGTGPTPAKTLARAKATPLMGYVGAWQGHAQRMLGLVPRGVLETARAYFRAQLETTTGTSGAEIRLRHRLTHQVAMITLVLEEAA